MEVQIQSGAESGGAVQGTGWCCSTATSLGDKVAALISYIDFSGWIECKGIAGLAQQGLGGGGSCGAGDT